MKKSFFDQFSFKVYAREVIGIVGKNGAGKTTLAKLICGFKREKSGYLKINGKKTAPRSRISQVYMVMQDADYQLFTEEVGLELSLGLKRKNSLETKIDDLLQTLQLNEKKNRHPSSLSGGEKQRVTIAWAVMSHKKIIILDEPTSGLDYDNMLRVVQLIEQLKSKGACVLIISHDYEFLLRSADRILELNQPAQQREYQLVEQGRIDLKMTLNCGQL